MAGPDQAGIPCGALERDRWGAAFRTRFARELTPALLGGVALAVVYAVQLWRMKEGPHDGAPGWWTWFDQGMTLRSAEAFARGDLSAAAHWYPPGYALLGAPFVALGARVHPFALVDLLCLIATYAAFLRVARRCGIATATGVAVFLAASLWNMLNFREWVIPWSSTPVAALLWAMLAVSGGRPLLLGAMAGLVAWFRPIDVLPAAVCLVGGLAQAGPSLRGALRAAAGGLLALGALAAVHLAIHGPAVSPYMVQSGRLGFTLHDFGWKAYVILIDPAAWFPEGRGLVRRLPFMLLGLAALGPALAWGGVARVLAAALSVHLVVYVSYVDLLPTGLWRFNNIHYWKWAVPGYGLLGYLLLTALWRRSWFAAVGLAAALGLSCLRVGPEAVGAGEPAKMVVLEGPAPSFEASYFSEMALGDGLGEQRNVYDFRAMPDPAGTRVIGLRRDFVGAVAWAGPVRRFGERWTVGAPCWIAAALCDGR